MSLLADGPELEAARRFVAATLAKREAEARVRETKNVLRAIQPSLLAYLSAAGIKSVTIDGYALSPHRTPWIYPIKGVSKQEVCEALRIAGLGHMVREDFSISALTAHIEQLEERAQLLAGVEGEAEDETGGEDEASLARLLHPALAKIMQVQAAFSLHVRKKSGPYDKYEKANDEDEGATDNDD